MKGPVKLKNRHYKETLSKTEEWLDYQEEKRHKERDLPINEIDGIIPIYDTDGMPFEEGAFNDVSGMTAPPSRTTIKKSLTRLGRGEKRQKYAGMPPLTVGEGTLRAALYGVTDYHEAMMENILREQDFKGKTFKFTDKPKSPRKKHVQAFEYVQEIRDFYSLEEDVYEKRNLKEVVMYDKRHLPTKLALRLFALEEIDKNWFQGYLPFKTYEALKEQAKESLDAVDRVYKETTGKDPLPMRKKALEQEVNALWTGN